MISVLNFVFLYVSQVIKYILLYNYIMFSLFEKKQGQFFSRRLSSATNKQS